MKHASKASRSTRSRGFDKALSKARAFHERGYLVEAERLYRELLELHPNHFEVLCNLGSVLAGLARPAQAVESYERALVLQPDHALLHSRYADALAALKRWNEALSSYERALELAPGQPAIHFNRGVILQELERHEDALASYEQCVKLDARDAAALNNRGNVLFDLERYREALASYELALAINPRFAPALNNRGNALRKLEHDEEAWTSYELAIAADPTYPDAYFNLGLLCQVADKRQAAIANYGKAIAHKPDYAEAFYMRGTAFQSLNLHQPAIQDFTQALALGSAATPTDTAGNLLHAKMQLCDWNGYDDAAGNVIARVRAGELAIPPFALLAISDCAADHLLCARAWARDKFPDSGAIAAAISRHKRIRVAYLSADFYEHAVFHLSAGLYERHDRALFEIIALSFGRHAPNPMTSRLQAAFDRFIDVSERSDDEIAALMAELEIDIAVDLMGYTRGSRTGIFARRAAPIQVSYLGYAATVGVDYIDYLIADRWVIPPEHAIHYAERIVYLPDSFQVNDSERLIADRTPTRAEADLPELGFVFCSFNKSFKITPAMFDIWMRLLQQVEDSVLWLSARDAATVSNLRLSAEKRGVAPSRLVFASRTEKLEDHLARHRLADLFLDTLPYNAHTTASDSLWAGLPVVTCSGDAFAARVGESLLNAVGLPELAIHTLADYEALALKLARDRSALAAIRAKLARNRTTHPLFDTDRFRRHLEMAYAMMWERRQRGEPSASFAVPAVSSPPY